MNPFPLHSLRLARLASLASGALRCLSAVSLATLLSQCSFLSSSASTRATNVVVSVKEQKLALYDSNGSRIRAYPVSTSKFGLNDKPGTYGTPLGMHEVVAKIGHGAPKGAVFKSRVPTGEVLKPDSPGRDPIVSRIMWLRGLEKQNQNAFRRCIYIHGTAEERNVGKPVSYGCIRMKSTDVIDLFGRMSIGSKVLIGQEGLPGQVPAMPVTPPSPLPSEQPPIFLDPSHQVRPQRGRPDPSLLAANTRTGSGPGTASPTVASTDSAPVEEPEAGGMVSQGSFQSRALQNGSTVIYSAQGEGQNSQAPIVLKSRRSANQNLNRRPTAPPAN